MSSFQMRQGSTSAAVAVHAMSSQQVLKMKSSKRLGAVASGFARAAARQDGASIRESYKIKPSMTRRKSQRHPGS